MILQKSNRALFHKGDCVVFRRMKCNTQPSRRAQNIQAAHHGDDYYYVVEKCWIVAEVLKEGKLLLKTRSGKSHIVDASDPKLRPASIWDKIRYRSRFSQLQLPTAAC
ncbi:hypothetical protein [Bythopirellula goksoeyrii]|nr:hypothetical protein [Bythopirellula goksoeyrii]